MNTSDISRIKHLLVALDESENARRAVQYVSDMLAGLPGFTVTLVTVILNPPEDYFYTDDERRKWIEDQESRARRMLEEQRDLLIKAGFDAQDVAVRVEVKDCPSVGECILSIQGELGCGTVVVGRRGISKKEEFIFGSTSSKILHAAKNCSVWAIE